MIYFDNAATSFPKPREVIAEVSRCMRFYCGNPGRGSHALAMAAAERIFECRTRVAAMFGSSHPENVIFTANATHGLNIAVKGLLRPGDHVLLSDMEHNAVYRPIYRLAEEGLITYDIFPTMINDSRCSPVRICAGIARLVKPNTKMLICAHASNLCSYTLPLEELGSFCRKRGILFVVDAAQSAGRIPISAEQMGIDALCAPGHKGLWGPQGSGFLLLREGLVADTLTEGGSGMRSLEGSMPESAPERYEAGTLATPAIVGLSEGIRILNQIGMEAVAKKEAALVARLRERLSDLPGVTLYAPQYEGGILLFNIDGIPAENVGNALNRMGFCVRSGYHCAALGHRTLETPEGGAVRVSPGWFNTLRQINALADAIREIRRQP